MFADDTLEGMLLRYLQDMTERGDFELSGMLAPENIHEDGQISLYEADVKYNRILKTIKKLNKHFSPPEALRDESDEPDAFFGVSQ